MTNTKLLEKLKNLTKNTNDVDEEHIKQLRKVLRKLKKRKHKLAEERQAADNDHDRLKIDQEIEVLQLQRKKGVVIYKQLKKEQEEYS